MIPATNITTANYDITLYYKNSELTAWGADRPLLQMIKSDAATIDASTTSNSIVVSPLFTDYPALGYCTYKANFTGFSKFALVKPIALPLCKIDFKANKKNDGIALHYTIECNSDVKEIVVEKSLTGLNYHSIFLQNNLVLANTLYSQTSIDATAAKGYNYYRLKVTTTAGQVKYPDVLLVNFNGKGNVITISPNPAPDKIYIVTGENFINPQIQVMNAAGKMQRAPYQITGNKIIVNTSMLPSGVYIMKIMDGNTAVTEKIVISR